MLGPGRLLLNPCLKIHFERLRELQKPTLTLHTGAKNSLVKLRYTLICSYERSGTVL